jgi:hypothetical protein
MRSFAFFIALLAVACSPDRGRPMGDGGTGGPDGTVAGCDASADMDGDGIADAIEGSGDSDGDGTADRNDDDSDADGYPDRDEAGSGGNPCIPRDTDSDGTPDFRDADSDQDGLPDLDERTYGTNPLASDSDGDDVPDIVEVRGSMTDPLDPMSRIDLERDFYVVLPYEGDHQMRELRFSTDIKRADVFFLVDMTGSMQGERTNLINGLLDVIIPGIRSAITDVQFGAGGFDDYPYESFGWACGYGTIAAPTWCDRPFYLLRGIAPDSEDIGAWSIAAGPTTCPRDMPNNDIGTITGAANGIPDIFEAVQGLPCHAGNDGPESYVPAMWATATGMALSWPAHPTVGSPAGMVPARTCPMIPDEVGLRRGYPCFRPGALPIILLFGDNEFHNGPAGMDPYSFPAPTYDETVTAMNAIGARVIGIYSSFAGGAVGPDYLQIATDTGAVRGDGTPLGFTINSDGTGLTTAVVDAVAELVGGTPQDVSTRTENVMGNPDDFDATRFIKSIVPLEGYRDGIPGTGYTSKDMTTFYGVIPGTVVDFTVDFYNDVRPVTMIEVHRARIWVVGNGVADLDSRDVYILIPTEEGGPILI